MSDDAIPLSLRFRFRAGRTLVIVAEAGPFVIPRLAEEPCFAR